MFAELDSDSRLEIAHVLFMDIVGYSKLLVDEQSDLARQLNLIVRGTEQFLAAEAAGRLVRLPTGDGMALAFFTSPDAPVRCAIEIAQALQEHPQLRLRMGIDSGPVDQVSDVNDRANIAGGGINMAQRVMDCGDAGHILLSKRVAGDLGQYSKWQPQLHDLGEVEVKHGLQIGIVNLVDGYIGNPALPEKIRRLRHMQRATARRRAIFWSLGAVAALAALYAIFWIQTRRAALPAAPSVVEKSIAVLPFESLSKDEENAFFAGGVQDEVLTNLARIADLKVISRTSVMNYKAGTARNIREIAKSLGVAHILEGSVQRAANRVRVTAQLIDARTDTHVWAEHYDRELADVFAIQSEIAQKISEQLGARLSPRESTELASRPTQDIAAFESYIRARALMETPDVPDEHEKFVEDNTRAVQLLEQAAARDRKFVAAYWALTEANIQLFRSSGAGNTDYRARAEAALHEAQRLAPDAGETYYAQSHVTYYGYYDFKAALANLEQAAKSLPNRAEVALTRAYLYRRFGRWQEAYAQFVRSSELNPQDIAPYIGATAAAIGLRWWDEFDQMVERIAKHFPRQASMAAGWHGWSLAFRGDVAASNKQMESVKLQMPGDFDWLFYSPFFKRDFEQCRRLLTDAAKYSELQDQRWDMQLQLTFMTKFPFDEQAAREAEKRLEGRLAGSIHGEEQRDLIIALSNVKMLLGKKEEALRIAEESVEQHPISEDAATNVPRLAQLAFIYLYAGENDRALQTFAKLVQIPYGTWYGLLRDDPKLDKLRSDPRFDEILKQSQQPFPRL